MSRKEEYIHLYPCDDLINNIAIPTGISSSYSENGDHLFSVTVLNDKISEDDLINGVMKRLKVIMVEKKVTISF